MIPSDMAPGDAPYTVFSGFCMGTADVVPGVSGGTMAVALGIYEQLIAAISSVGVPAARSLLRLRVRELLGIVHWRFLASLLCGMAVGIGLMVKVVKLPHMVTASSPHRPLVYAIFFGMVVGSAITLGRHLPRWNGLRVLALLAGTGVGFAIVNLVPVDTPDHPLFIFLCGGVAICAMLLPGISGSFILLILGKYAYILGAVGELQFSVVLPFVAGCGAGVLSFSRLLGFLLRKYRATMLASLIGLLIGSLWRIWPYQHIEEVVVRGEPRTISAVPFWPEALDATVFGLMLGGVALVVAIEWYAVKRRARHLAPA